VIDMAIWQYYRLVHVEKEGWPRSHDPTSPRRLMLVIAVSMAKC